MLKILQINVMCQVNVRSKVKMKHFLRFGLPGRLDGLQRAHFHQKCWANVHEGYCMSTKGTRKNDQGQGQVTEGDCKIKVINMPCDTCFLGSLHADIDGDSHLTICHPT